MKKLILAAVMGIVTAPFVLAADTIVVNDGVELPLTEFSIVSTADGARISVTLADAGTGGTNTGGTDTGGTDTGGTDTGGTDTGGTDTGGTDTGGTDAAGWCTTTPADETVVVLDPVIGGVPTPKITVPITTTNIVAEPFQSSSTATYRMEWSLAALPTSVSDTRRIWISQCPGAAEAIPGNCDRTMTETGNIRTINQDYTTRALQGLCRLEPGGKYYLNVQNTACDNSSCQVRRDIFTKAE